MQLKIIANTETEVVADYIGKEQTVKNIRIDGDFSDLKEAKESVVLYLLTKRIISPGQYLGLLSSIKNQKTKEFYSEIGKKGLNTRWNKK